jgi:ATP-dependent RNA helicase DeaD
VDAAPVIARGHNLAIVVPPVPAAAVPYLLAIPDRRATFVVTADADRAAALAAALPRGPSLAVTGLARAQRKLATGAPDFLFASAPDALALLSRSALKVAEFQTVVLAWPEQLDEPGREALESVMAETARDAQRMVLTASAGPVVESVLERYAMKAVTFGFPPAEPPQAPAATLGPASFVVARPAEFEATRLRVLDALDPERDDDVTIVPCPASREAAETLAAAGSARAAPWRLVFLLEPSQLTWLRGLFSPLTPLRLPTALGALEQRAAAIRARLTRTLQSENLDRELFLIGPLLDRFDPAEVAAAALRLADVSVLAQIGGPALAARVGASAEAAEPSGLPTWAKLWVGVGRKDDVGPGDVLGAIVGEAKLPADHVGRIEVRELFCLVEIRSEDAERVVRALTGTTLRGRRITARVDRGRGHPHGSRRPARTREP